MLSPPSAINEEVIFIVRCVPRLKFCLFLNQFRSAYENFLRVRLQAELDERIS